jgi:hypothetical protein
MRKGKTKKKLLLQLALYEGSRRFHTLNADSVAHALQKDLPTHANPVLWASELSELTGGVAYL